MRVVAAKTLASMLAGIGVGLIAEALTAGAEAIGLGLRGIHIGLGIGDYAQLLAGDALAAALFAAIGVGVGTIVRNQVATVVGLCVWLLFLEPLLLGDVPAAAKYAPEASAGAIAGRFRARSPTRSSRPPSACCCSRSTPPSPARPARLSSPAATSAERRTRCQPCLRTTPSPTLGGAEPPAWLVALFVVVVLIVFALHLTGVVGPG